MGVNKRKSSHATIHLKKGECDPEITPHFFSAVHPRAYDVDVSKVRVALCEHAGLCWLRPDIPNFDGPITGAGGHHVLLVRGPPET